MRKIANVSFAVWILACLFIVMVVRLLIADMDVMIRNESLVPIKVISCELNDQSISNCSGMVADKQVFFINPQRYFYPENNKFALTLSLGNTSTQLTCDFKKVSRECIAEMLVDKNNKLICAANCIGVYQ